MSAPPSLPSLPSLLPSLPSSLPQPFSSLSLLLAAEEEDSKRIRVSKLGWWVDVKRIKGSTLGRIWRAVLGFSLWSGLVAIMEQVYGKELGRCVHWCDFFSSPRVWNNERVDRIDK